VVWLHHCPVEQSLSAAQPIMVEAAGPISEFS
jgi:hypothetical protein